MIAQFNDKSLNFAMKLFKLQITTEIKNESIKNKNYVQK